MKKTQFKSIKISSFVTDIYESPLHSHTYYEIIYIFSGTGQHHINQSVLSYKKGDLFLISPGDEHFFVVKDRTDFMYIKFNDSFFEEGNLPSSNFSISFSPAYIMNNAQLKEIKLKFPKPYKSILKKISISIREYSELKDVTKSAMIYFLVLSIFELIRETALKMQIRVEGMHSREDDLISYIHQNIYHPEKLKVKQIADTFNLSVNYFSTYFKKKNTISYNEYIAKYKLQLIERRISSNSSSLKNIAEEFGFTDLSHLNNFFKRNKKMSPTAYMALIKKENSM